MLFSLPLGTIKVMTLLQAPGRCKVDVSVLPVFRAKDYELLPPPVREFLGGLTHQEHIKHVNSLIKEDLEAGRLSPLGLFSASELFEEAATFDLEAPSLETLLKVVSQEVLGGGTYLEYESAEALLEDTFDSDAESAEMEEDFLMAFDDLMETFGKEEIDKFYTSAASLVSSLSAEVNYPALFSLSLRWADHQLQASVLSQPDANSLLSTTSPEFAVAMALLATPGSYGMLAVVAKDSTEIEPRVWKLESSTFLEADPLEARALLNMV